LRTYYQSRCIYGSEWEDLPDHLPDHDTDALPGGEDMHGADVDGGSNDNNNDESSGADWDITWETIHGVRAGRPIAGIKHVARTKMTWHPFYNATEFYLAK
jgi:hypothetical protein